MQRKASFGTYQQGVTLLEVMGGLAVGTIMIAGLATMANVSIEDTKAQQAALHQNALGKAVVSWMSDATNRSAVISTATTSAPRKITLAELTPHLPAGFSAQNPYQQTVCVMAYYDSATERIEVAATTEGGVTINDAQLGYIVAHAGSGAGAIYSSQPTVARGAFGSWQVTVADYTTSAAARNCSGTPAAAGNLMTLLPFDESGLFGMTGAGEWLARNQIPGRPELNRMNTTLDMGDNRVVGLQQVLNVPTDSCTAAREGKAGRTTTGAPRLCASGAWVAAACSTGDLASATDGKLLSCQGGVWKTQGSAFWEDAVTDVASLPACGASISGQTRVVLNAADGAGRPRAYTCNGAAWTALALDNNGNLTVPGTVTATNATVTNTVTANVVNAATRVVAGTDIRAPRYYDSDNTGYYVDPASTSRLNYINMDGAQINTVATEGSTCSPNGRIARNNVGLILSCQSGVWRKASGDGSFWASEGGAPCSRYTVFAKVFAKYYYYGEFGGIGPVVARSPALLPSGYRGDLLACTSGTTSKPGGLLCVNGKALKLTDPKCDTSVN